jgi:hypothetical protein
MVLSQITAQCTRLGSRLSELWLSVPSQSRLISSDNASSLIERCKKYMRQFTAVPVLKQSATLFAKHDAELTLPSEVSMGAAMPIRRRRKPTLRTTQSVTFAGRAPSRTSPRTCGRTAANDSQHTRRAPTRVAASTAVEEDSRLVLGSVA